MKMLINGLTLENGNIIPLLLKIKYWQSKNCIVTIFGNNYLKEKIENLGIIKHYEFVGLKNIKKIRNKYQFITEGLKRNIISFKYINYFKKYDVIYSISSVLDLTLLPWILKNFNKKIKWVTVFDNIVPITDPGNKFIRFLAWIFFQISIFLIKKADIIFVSTPELFEYLKNRKFNIKKLVLTGFAVENDLIKKASSDKKYNIDALFVGRINETKGIYDMLNVLAIIRKKYPNFQLAFMGNGDEVTETQFRNKISEMNLKKNIQFLGFKSGIEKFKIIKSSKTFWFLSKSESESFGIALLEAVCCGLPAFVYDLIPFRNIYKNNEVITGKIGDYQAIAKKVIELFDNEDFVNVKGILLLDKYSWDNIAEKELSSFKNILI
jgi:glycosyltransferase involved in cell wall biosynthesis